MTIRKFSFLLYLLIALLSTGCSRTPTFGKAPTAQDCVKDYQKALATGNWKHLAQCLAPPFGESVAVTQKLDENHRLLRKVAKEAFGGDALSRLNLDKERPQPGSVKAQIEIIEVKPQGDRATATYRETVDGNVKTTTVALAKFPAGWKITNPSVEENSPADLIRLTQQMTDFLEIQRNLATSWGDLARRIGNGQLKHEAPVAKELSDLRRQTNEDIRQLTGQTKSSESPAKSKPKTDEKPSDKSTKPADKPKD